MNEFIIEKYIDKLTINHIKEYAKNQGIELKNNEDEVIYSYIKKYYKELCFNDNNDNILNELKCKLSLSTYNVLEKLYKEAKEKINFN